MDLREIGLSGIDWIDLAPKWDQWKVLLNTIMNLRVLKCWEILDWVNDWQLLKKG
jgi:hypothetical protein